jgi:hypothetical protein
MITINDHDIKHKKVNIPIINGFQYIFQGLNSHVESGFIDQTYLSFRIIKVPEDRISPLRVVSRESLSTETLYNMRSYTLTHSY